MTNNQKTDNNVIMNVIDNLDHEISLNRTQGHIGRYVGRLKSCQAWIYECDSYFYLVSYNTIVACVDKESKIGYDFLRKVYGYTSTSAQHISKFMHEYASTCVRWYPIKENKED